MYLRVSRFRFNPAQYDEMLPLVQKVGSALHGMPGNQHVHMGIDRAGGRGYAVSTWDTAAHASFARETAPQLSEVVSKLLGMGMQIDPPEISEIVS